MTQPTAQPQYLPAVDRQLEYRAGTGPLAAPAPPSAETHLRRSRQWLGTDFTHSITSR